MRYAPEAYDVAATICRRDERCLRQPPRSFYGARRRLQRDMRRLRDGVTRQRYAQASDHYRRSR